MGKITGTEGDDLLVGGNKADTIKGEGGDDKILAGYGNDKVEGGAGDDQITGDKGADQLSGGTGANVFNYNHPEESEKNHGDTINGFQVGIDKINLAPMAAYAQGVHLLPEEVTITEKKPGQFQVVIRKGTWAPSLASMEITVNTLDGSTLTHDDFIL